MNESFHVILVNSRSSMFDLAPLIKDDIKIEQERQGSPTKMTIKVVKTKGLSIKLGASIRFTWEGHKIFKGFVFDRTRDKDQVITYICYDQLRYFKNKDTFIYKYKTCDEVLKMVCKKFNLKTGTIDKGKYTIKKRVEDNKTLFDVVKNAVQFETDNTGRILVLYDNFGKLCLRDVSNLTIEPQVWAVTSANIEDYDYNGSIDKDTYNQILLYRDEDSSKKKGTKSSGKVRKRYVAKDSKNIGKWGILQYTQKIEDGENGKSKANALLKYYDHYTRSLTLKGVVGYWKVRAGSRIWVRLNLGDLKLNSYVLVEKATHTFKDGLYLMDLTVIGGESTAGQKGVITSV